MANNNLSILASKLNSTQTRNLESITDLFSVGSQEEFNSEYARYLAKERIESTKGVEISSKNGVFPYIVSFSNGLYAVEVSPVVVLKRTGRQYLKRYGKELKEDMERADCLGVIHFMPFQMNGNKIRSTIAKELPIGFVDLRYNKRRLDQLFWEYEGCPIREKNRNKQK